ncbi:MAG: TolC family protein [Acidobacteriota bacterium]
MVTHLSARLAIAATTALLSAAVGFPAVPPESPPLAYAPGRSTTATVSLKQAIELALEHDPALRLSEESARLSAASWRQSLGLFDHAVTAGAHLEKAYSLVTTGEMGAQLQRRMVASAAAELLQKVADDITRQLQSEGMPVGIECPAGTDIVLPDGTSICFSGRAASRDRLLYDISQSLDQGDVSEAMETWQRLQMETIRDITALAAYASREILRGLGVQATVADRTALGFDLGLLKQFRSGPSLTTQLQFEGVQDTYRGKPLNPALGGRGVLNSYRSTLGVSLDVPLGQGRGVVSTGAAERAARLSHEASLDSQAHSAAETALQTTLAYWNLVAAQDRLALLEKSVATEERLMEMGRALVEAGELAPVDLVYLNARLEATHGSVESARSSLLEARLALANSLGLSVEEVGDAPLAAEGFSAPVDRATLDGWRAMKRGGEALDRRGDVQAAKRLEESSRVLAEAGRADLTRRTDLSFSVYYSSLHEANESADLDSTWRGVRYGLGGYYTGPSAVVSLKIDWPFKNNLSRGRFEQRLALLEQSRIERSDLERVSSLRAEQLFGALERTLAEVRNSEAAVSYHRQMLDAELEKYQLGASTAIDVVLTEENLINESVSLILARQKAAGLEARLRFELGGLVRYRLEDDRVVIEEVTPIG